MNHFIPVLQAREDQKIIMYFSFIEDILQQTNKQTNTCFIKYTFSCVRKYKQTLGNGHNELNNLAYNSLQVHLVPGLLRLTSSDRGKKGEQGESRGQKQSLNGSRGHFKQPKDIPRALDPLMINFSLKTELTKDQSTPYI